MFQTNVFGLVAMTQPELPGMRAHRRGAIVDLSSIGGLVSFGATGYDRATQYAVEGLSESLAIEVEPLGLHVVVVEPGPFRTDFAGRSDRDRGLRCDGGASGAGRPSRGASWPPSRPTSMPGKR